MEDILKEMCRKALITINCIISLAEKEHLTNKQFYIDFEDRLNEFSVMDHNRGDDDDGNK